MEQARISSAQGTQTPQTARNRQGNDAAGAAASPGGFLALLSALDEVAEQGALQDNVMGDVADAGVGLAGKDPDADADAVDALAAAVWQGLVAQDAAAAPQASAQGSGAAAGGAAVGDDTVSLGATALIGGGGLRHGLVAETALLDGAGDLQDAAPQGSVAGYGRILSRMQSAMAQRAVNGGAAGSPEAVAGRATAGVNTLQTTILAQSLSSGFQSVGEHTAAVTGQSVGTHLERAGGSALAALASEALSSGAAGQLGGAVSARGGDAPGGGRSGEGQPGGTAWSDGTMGSAPHEASGVEGAPVFADAPQPGAEEHVTDQVAYWVNQKTQNAELTLDRDGQPVEVSVSLSGNEAHVTFRSDQSETRELLDRSMAQLSELLRSEGLVLSGTTVGTSARDGAGAGGDGQPRQREGARQAQVVSTVPAGDVAVQRTGGTTERTVDIFV